MADIAESPGHASGARDGAQKPAVLVTGVSGNLGLRLLELLPDFNVIGVDIRPPKATTGLAHFEKIDLAEERSCNQLLDLMRRHRPDAIVHLAFVFDPLRAGVVDERQMWHINVAGTGRVIEAVAEHNRMLGGLHKFIFPSSISVYGPDLPKPVAEDAPLQAHTLPYALQKRETDLTVQARAYSMKCKTYILRPAIFVGPTVQNYLVGVLRGVPGGNGALAGRLRRRNKKLPLLIPSRGNYLEHKFQFVHLDDIARLIAYILRRRKTDPQLSIMNVAGRGDPMALHTCAKIANAQIKRLPGRALCRLALRLLWKLGISDVPPEAFPYLVGSYVMETARLRVFLGEDYKKVIHHTCEEALAATFHASAPGSAQRSVAT
ncbi:MAG TPA: NAD-dependent epimerase/dehydratase family protein [Candidatus Angelobacter sp.]|nr:NAD-dependent epimerase/dehydratase family protein [Candidatus Angelobacter sp.]